MQSRCIRELMIPLEELPTVTPETTLNNVLTVFENAERLAPGDRPTENVIVIDEAGNAVGKIGPHALLQALEPKYMEEDDLRGLSRFGLTSGFLASMMNHYTLLDGDLHDLWHEARHRQAKDIMHPITEDVDADASTADVIHRFIMWNTASLIVTRDGQGIGLLRVSDLLHKIVSRIRTSEMAAE